MKQVYLLCIAVFFTVTIFAQGISVQGIARDNTNSAIADTNLSFTFSITKTDNTILYAERQSIRTDNFGVFSHILSMGSPVTSTFSAIDFSIEDLKLKISVNYSGSTIEFHNQDLQYTPYAHFAKKAAVATMAENGVPVGTIVAYAGSVAPAGWLFCHGAALSGVETNALRALIGANVPDLRGAFLRGSGTSGIAGKGQHIGPNLLTMQDDTYKSHNHGATASIVEAGKHRHQILQLPSDGIPGLTTSNMHTLSLSNTSGSDEAWRGNEVPWISDAKHLPSPASAISEEGAHTHSASVTVAASGGTETRPFNMGVNYIIKL
jgi:microcystin-dependent protein